MSKSEFEDISIPKWKLSMSGANNTGQTKAYRVFSNAKEFVTVEAGSATEAVAKSGVAKVYMVRVGQQDDMTMLDRSMLAQVMAEAAVQADINPIPAQ